MQFNISNDVMSVMYLISTYAFNISNSLLVVIIYGPGKNPF